jgi:hypothetical protein
MRFTAILATSAAVTGALAGLYEEEPAYVTVDDKVYTSVKTCTDKPYEPTEAPVYEPTTTDSPVYEVTYTSYEKVTITSCADYVVSCPAETYTSTSLSVSTCGGYSSTAEYYVPPVNTTDVYYAPPVYETEVPTYEAPSEYPAETTTPCTTSSEVYPTEYPTETHTYYTTLCPGKDYCYATTVTSTYCPGKPTETSYVPEVPTYVPEKPSYAPETPTYTHVPYVPSNETTYVPPPSYTGAASSNAVSFGALALAGLALLL